MTIMVVMVIVVIVQSMVLLSQARSRTTNQVSNVRVTERTALNGLECGLAQVVYQQALSGGEAGSCLGQDLEFVNSDYEDYSLEFVVFGDRATCARVQLRQNKTDNYTIRSAGYLVCGGSGPIEYGFQQERVVRIMNVEQSDEGQVSRSVVEN